MNDTEDAKRNDAEPMDEDEAVKIVGGGVDDGDDDVSTCSIHNLILPCALCGTPSGT